MRSKGQHAMSRRGISVFCLAAAPGAGGHQVAATPARGTLYSCPKYARTRAARVTCEFRCAGWSRGRCENPHACGYCPITEEEGTTGEGKGRDGIQGGGSMVFLTPPYVPQNPCGQPALFWSLVSYRTGSRDPVRSVHETDRRPSRDSAQQAQSLTDLVLRSKRPPVSTEARVAPAMAPKKNQNNAVQQLSARQARSAATVHAGAQGLVQLPFLTSWILFLTSRKSR